MSLAAFPGVSSQASPNSRSFFMLVSNYLKPGVQRGLKCTNSAKLVMSGEDQSQDWHVGLFSENSDSKPARS